MCHSNNSRRRFATTKNPLSFATTTRLEMSNNDDDDDTYDLAVIGAGVVGVQAALVASSSPYNKKVCIIDAPRASGMLMNEATNEDLSIGGPTGLFSKALRDTSKRIKVSTLRGMGLREDSVWNEIISSCVDLASSNANDIKRQLSYAEVDLIQGFASFPDGGGTNSLLVTNEDHSVTTIKTKNTLIASGSKPFRPGGIPFDGIRVFDSDSINQLAFLPKSVVITGSGIIAIEFAKIFRNLGSDVTILIRDKIPRNALMKIGLDKDVSATLIADLVRSGIKVERGCQVKQFIIPKDASTNFRVPIKIELESSTDEDGRMPSGRPTELLCDAYLAAVGRKPNTQNLNLASAGINVDRYGDIIIDSKLATTAPSGNVYAAGDVLGRPFLASTGVAQGIAAVTSMFGNNEGVASNDDTCNTGELTKEEDGENNSIENYDDASLCIDGDISASGESFDPKSLASNPFAFPTGVWTSPEAAYYGLSVQQANEFGIDAGEGIALYAECLRGQVFSPNGLLKLVYEKPNGRILGVHICGDDACELIHYGMELVKAKRTLRDVAGTIYSAVTFHEMYKIAANAALDEAGARKRRAAAGKALAKRMRSVRSSE